MISLLLFYHHYGTHLRPFLRAVEVNAKLIEQVMLALLKHQIQLMLKRKWMLALFVSVSLSSVLNIVMELLFWSGPPGLDFGLSGLEPPLEDPSGLMRCLWISWCLFLAFVWNLRRFEFTILCDEYCDGGTRVDVILGEVWAHSEESRTNLLKRGRQVISRHLGCQIPSDRIYVHLIFHKTCP